MQSMPASREHSLLLTCLGALAADAPCEPRIQCVIDAVAGDTQGRPGNLPDTAFARSIAIAALMRGADARIGERHDPVLAQAAIDGIWRQGPIRPGMVATQLHCLVGKRGADRRCRWSCVTTDPRAHGHEARNAVRPGLRVQCMACGRDGTLLGSDPDDGWTVVDHHSPVVMRPDGMWEVDRTRPSAPTQCGYLASPDPSPGRPAGASAAPPEAPHPA
jgi:hypothetical protein